MKIREIFARKNHKKLSVILILITIAVSAYLFSARTTNSFLFFPTENQILTFSNKTISKEKGKESSEFNVYLFKDLKSRRPESTQISSFRMPFHKDEIDSPWNEDTDYKWYTIAEVGDNKWIFANCINDGSYYLFDISYSAGKKKLVVSNSRRSGSLA
ncbi:MAG: hypothetical protein LWY06_18720, partial [Firmicutes bacterium]|nr:hypothetical protein [Bacillota bacterium]